MLAQPPPTIALGLALLSTPAALGPGLFPPPLPLRVWTHSLLPRHFGSSSPPPLPLQVWCHSSPHPSSGSAQAVSSSFLCLLSSLPAHCLPQGTALCGTSGGPGPSLPSPSRTPSLRPWLLHTPPCQLFWGWWGWAAGGCLHCHPPTPSGREEGGKPCCSGSATQARPPSHSAPALLVVHAHLAWSVTDRQTD